MFPRTRLPNLVCINRPFKRPKMRDERKDEPNMRVVVAGRIVLRQPPDTAPFLLVQDAKSRK